MVLSQDVELAGRWWQWAMSIPTERNPVCDETGRFAGANQPADVWFLAGTFGGKASRRCEIPHGRPIFFPLFNMMHRTTLRNRRIPYVASASGHAELNGVPLPVREVANRKPFPVEAVEGGPFGEHGRYKATAWGLWAALEDLAYGNYILTFGGEYEPGGFWVEATYDLEIV